MAPLSSRLRKLAKEIAKVAREYGLDFYETIFEIVDYKMMNELAAYEGFSTRYPHWRFGMEYERLKKSYSYGLHKIYEMVINNDPTYAYLLEGNSETDHKLVMAHVYAHSDFFKNNMFFSHTNRKMIDEMANHAVRIREYMDKYGVSKVESFIDICLSINNLINYQFPYSEEKEHKRLKEELEREEEEIEKKIIRFKTKGYMDKFINPEEFVEEQRRRLRQEIADKKKRFPIKPVKDIMWFFIEYAPLEKWERDILSMIREEAYYFAPQGQTKIMNEGWAAFWHSKIMTERFLTDAEIIDFADHHSMTTQISPFSLNPYKLGIELFRNIKERWDKGQFGKEWEECTDIEKKSRWDRKLGLGMQKIFEVRKFYNDVTFIDEFFTPEFAWKEKYFIYGYNRRTGNYEIFSRDFKKIKEMILSNLTNFGQPYITLEDANYKNRGELYLIHRYEGKPLKIDYARKTLQNIQYIWKRPVHLRTVQKEKPYILSYDGKNFSEIVP